MYFKHWLASSILNQLGVSVKEGVCQNLILFKAFKVSMWFFWLLFSNHGLRSRFAFSSKVSPISNLMVSFHNLPGCIFLQHLITPWNHCAYLCAPSGVPGTWKACKKVFVDQLTNLMNECFTKKDIKTQELKVFWEEIQSYVRFSACLTQSLKSGSEPSLDTWVSFS